MKKIITTLLSVIVLLSPASCGKAETGNSDFSKKTTSAASDCESVPETSSEVLTSEEAQTDSIYGIEYSKATTCYLSDELVESGVDVVLKMANAVSSYDPTAFEEAFNAELMSEDRGGKSADVALEEELNDFPISFFNETFGKERIYKISVNCLYDIDTEVQEIQKTASEDMLFVEMSELDSELSLIGLSTNDDYSRFLLYIYLDSSSDKPEIEAEVRYLNGELAVVSFYAQDDQ